MLTSFCSGGPVSPQQTLLTFVFLSVVGACGAHTWNEKVKEKKRKEEGGGEGEEDDEEEEEDEEERGIEQLLSKPPVE